MYSFTPINTALLRLADYSHSIVETTMNSVSSIDKHFLNFIDYPPLLLSSSVIRFMCYLLIFYIICPVSAKT